MTGKVLITIGQLNVGGAERRLLHLMRTIRAQSIPLDVTFFVVSGKPGTLDSQFKNYGAKLVYGQPGFAGLISLFKLCRETKPDVLHVNAETAAGFYALTGFLARVPLRIAQFRSMQVDLPARRKIKSIIYQLITNAFCHRIIGVSTGSRRRRIILRPWQTVYNGITPPTDAEMASIEIPDGFDGNKIRILVLGRLIKTKNVFRSLEIFSEFIKLEPNAELHIAGPYIDVSREDILCQVRGLDLGNSVKLHGQIDLPYNFLSHSSLLLLTSRVEGLPGAVIEALACGTPVVSNDLPGSLEIAESVEGVCCLSLDRTNADWVEAIQKQLKYSHSKIRRSFLEGPFMTPKFVDGILKAWNVSF